MAFIGKCVQCRGTFPKKAGRPKKIKGNKSSGICDDCFAGVAHQPPPVEFLVPHTDDDKNKS